MLVERKSRFLCTKKEEKKVLILKILFSVFLYLFLMYLGRINGFLLFFGPLNFDPKVETI